MLLVFLLFVVSCLLCVCVSFDMIVGDTVHRKMVFHQRVKDFAIPFKKRIKSLTYKDLENRTIKVSNIVFGSLYFIIFFNLWLAKHNRFKTNVIHLTVYLGRLSYLVRKLKHIQLNRKSNSTCFTFLERVRSRNIFILKCTSAGQRHSGLPYN